MKKAKSITEDLTQMSQFLISLLFFFLQVDDAGTFPKVENEDQSANGTDSDKAQNAKVKRKTEIKD